MIELKKYSTAGEHRHSGLFSLALFGLLFLLCACARADSSLRWPPKDDTISGNRNPETAVPADAWSALLDHSAYPYYTPLPPAVVTAIDGIYVKFDPKLATPIPCRRCPDYMNEGGIWKLRFEKGTFRILHLVTGWTGIGSYSLSGDQLLLFNDPKCPRELGRYTWRLDDGGLTLEAGADHCAADMRDHNLAQMTWQSCPPPAESGEKTAKLTIPEGC